MDTSYVSEVNGELIVSLINHMAYINKERVIISSLYGELVDITLNRNEMSEIARFIKNVYPTNSTLDLDKKTFEINPNWVVIKSGDKKIEIRPEMFIKIVNCFEESELKLMNESNNTQDIYNKIMSLDSSKPAEEIAKPIETVGQQTIKTQSIYNTIIDTLENETKGDNNNDNKQ